jgi:uncharacterized circularly permuted ATP-grasp superfamily protein
VNDKRRRIDTVLEPEYLEDLSTLDKIMDDGVLTSLPELSDDELGEAIERLREVETMLSGQRRQLHHVIDALQDEIVARYRSQQDEAPVSG